MTLDDATYQRLLDAARALHERHVRMTAGYGGVDVVNAAILEAGLGNEISFLDMSVAQVHGVWAAYHG